MPREYANIACAIGKGIDDRLKRIGCEPLPQNLADLLDRLTYRDETSLMRGRNVTTTPPKNECSTLVVRRQKLR